MRGAPHAEAEALQNTSDARGATLYVSLEPCVERTLGPPCAPALRAAGIARVVVGALDPNPTNAGRGVALLREAGVEVELAEDARARALVEDFSVSIAAERPYVRLKLAASLDGYVAPQPGSHWLTGDAARAYVRELRVAHDAVMVGAGTVRVDDPQLIVRPPYTRRTPYRRIVVCEDAPVPADSKIFAPVAGYAPTLALAPRGLRERFEPLAAVAELLFAGDDDARTLDLVAALRELKRVGITSVLCEGGPTLAARLLEHGHGSEWPCMNAHPWDALPGEWVPPWMVQRVTSTPAAHWV